MPTFTNPSIPNSPANSQEVRRPEAKADEPSVDPGEMQIVPVAADSSPGKPEEEFQLPDGWVVEVRPRGPNASVPPYADKYYHEPGTGRKFRSLLSVKKYLSGEEVTPTRIKLARKDPKEMQIVPANTSHTPTGLPDGWVVEVRARGPNSAVAADKYYYEPGTGRKFRSLLSVKRYLSGEEEPSPKKKPCTRLVPYHQSSAPFTRVVYGGKVLRPDELEEARRMKFDDICPETSQFHYSDTLPDGWLVEEVPRKNGVRSDRYFIDPVSGKRFRSIPEVRRFLEGQKSKRKCKALTLSNCPTAARSPHPRKKNTSTKSSKDRIFDLTKPPKKINWVYTGEEKDDWSPLVEECMLPSYVKEQWSETFLSGMHGGKHCLPQLTMNESNLG